VRESDPLVVTCVGFLDRGAQDALGPGADDDPPIRRHGDGALHARRNKCTCPFEVGRREQPHLESRADANDPEQQVSGFDDAAAKLIGFVPGEEQALARLGREPRKDGLLGLRGEPFDMDFELGPTGEAVLACDSVLRLRQRGARVL
jgi:hypothetical protein